MITHPEQEIRFTRARQARVFFVSAALSLLAIFLGICCVLLPEPFGAPELQEFWWALIPLSLLFLISWHFARHCIKHAYLILTPLGIEIFPFFKAKKNLQLIYWSEIHAIDLKDEMLTIHLNVEKTQGLVITLKPISTSLYPLLQRALDKHNETQPQNL